MTVLQGKHAKSEKKESRKINGIRAFDQNVLPLFYSKAVVKGEACFETWLIVVPLECSQKIVQVLTLHA